MTIAIVGAILVGISLGLLGSGGAILTIPILIYLVGHAEKQAIAESFVIVGVIAVVGAAQRARNGQVHWRTVVFFGSAGMLGSLGGSALSRFVPGAVQLTILALLMLAAAVLMFRAPKPKAAEKNPTLAGEHGQPRRIIGRGVVLALGLGALVGVITGLTGIGGGFLIVPALVLLAGLSMPVAAGTSLAIIAANCAVGFFKHSTIVRDAGLVIDWRTVVIFAVVGAAGSIAGGALGARLNQILLRRIFAAFLLLLGVYVLAREVPGLLAGR
jgi:uncharacterized protein